MLLFAVVGGAKGHIDLALLEALQIVRLKGYVSLRLLLLLAELRR